jgi:hypothetical protein
VQAENAQHVDVEDQSEGLDDINKEGADLEQEGLPKRGYTVVGIWGGFTNEDALSMASADLTLTDIVPAIHSNRTLVHFYFGGEKCWKGGYRSAKMVYVCDSEDRIKFFYENGLCSYEIVFGTPSFCSPETIHKLQYLAGIGRP